MTIPTVEELTGAPLTVRFGEMFNPPAVTNFLGAAQVDRDLVALRNVNFPPLYGSDIVTGKLYLAGEYVEGTGAPVTFTWAPDRIVRTAELGDLAVTTTTITPMGHTAVVVRLEVENRGIARELDLHLRCGSFVTRFEGAMREAIPPFEETDRTVDDPRRALVFEARQTAAVCVQGLTPPADEIDDNGVWARAHVGAGERWTLSFAVAVGDDRDAALATYDAVTADVPALLEATRRDWNDELEAVVTPGNDRYSGSLPRLETDDATLRRLYHTGILGVVYFKRDTPASVVGRTYDTLMPKFWPTITFLWDYSLSSTVHALLDPEVMRRHLTHWMRTDIHTCMATSWVTGEGVGAWYAVNDYAMTRLMRDYLVWTGDHAWLDEKVETVSGEQRRPVDELVRYAKNWRKFETPNGLADYGGIGNLLECVSTYVHEVASLNAANVFNLRSAAEVLELRGEHEAAAELRAEADELVVRLDDLYVEGSGYYAARFPDGSLVPVRHCYDLLTLLYAMPEDLGPERRLEMVDHFVQELRTPTWLRALSNRDPDAAFSVRADHQWNGAYTAWPSEIVRGLYNIGEAELAADWMHGLAESAMQGPFGQAHFAEAVVDTHGGGARKVPPEFPFINDWACSSGGSWTAAVIEGVFGVRADHEGITATPRLTGFDPNARLVGLTHQGRSYTIDAEGLHEDPARG